MLNQLPKRIDHNFESHPAEFHRPDIVNEPLYVISPVFNPQRYRTRWKLYIDFCKYVLQSNEAILITIECSFGNRAEVMTKSLSEKHFVIHVHSSQEIWLKENLINIAISRLPKDAKYIAWIDADITFSRPDWVGETIQQLQHYDYVQMFSEAHDLNHYYESIRSYKSFMWCYKNLGINSLYQSKNHKERMKNNHSGTESYWHPGFAHACRLDLIDKVGGLIDWGILGGGDTFMCYALIGELNNRTMPKSLGKTGVEWLAEWQNRAEKFIKRNVGYVNGSIHHHWHGARKNRAYYDRGQILTRSRFDPAKDLKKDFQGVWQINPDNIILRDDARKYFGNRNEDSIDL